eukprot:jgi/Ulvmu1/11055/UM007_0237.1
MNDPACPGPAGDPLEDMELMPFIDDDDDFASFLELLDPEPPGVGSAGCTSDNWNVHTEHDPTLPPIPTDAEPETGPVEIDVEMARIERIRAKNRRGQARYREKLKREKQEVEARIDQTKHCLTDRNTRYRELRNQRATAVARLNSASAELDKLASYTPPALQTHTPAQSTAVPLPCSPEADRPSSNRPWPPTGGCSTKSRRPTTLVPLFGYNAGIYASVDMPVRDISSYSQSCAISLSDVCAQIPAGSDVLGSKDIPQYVPQAIREHQAAVSASIGVPREDICWFVQMPHTVPNGQPLSHSASIASTQCRISLMVFGEVLALEAGLLLEQHAALVKDSAAEVSANREDLPPADEAEANTAAGTSPGQLCLSEPVMPDATVCSQQLVRCGVNGTCTITEAVDGIIMPVVRRYRRKLPHAVWRGVCCKAMRKAESAYAAISAGMAAKAAAQVLSPRCGSTESVQGAHTGSMREGCAPIEAAEPSRTNDSSEGSTPDTTRSAEGFGEAEEEVSECQAMCAISASIAHFLWEELRADAPAGSSGTEMAHCSRQEVEARMLDVNMAPAVSCVMLFQQAPHTVRQLCQEASCHGVNLDQIERHQRRLLRSLALQPAQLSHCAQIWRQWYKKRRMLDREFDDAVDALTGGVPQVTEVPAEFVKLLDCLVQAPDSCQQPEAGGAANSSDFVNRLKQLRHLSDKLVGATGTSTEGSAAVLRALKSVHVTDGLLYEHVLFLTVMPSWYLTQVQHTKLHASMLDEGVTLVDNLRLCQAAAQEERWKEVFTTLHI